MVRLANGEYKEMTCKSNFTLTEAREAELIEKDVWIKYWRRMLDARAFTIGAREIADDLLLGIMSPNEVDEKGTFLIDKDGNEVRVD